MVQLYVSDLEAEVAVPRWELRGFRRVQLRPGERALVQLELTRRDLALIDEAGRCVLEPGAFRLYVGGQQPDLRSKELTGNDVLSTNLVVTGAPVELEC